MAVLILWPPLDLFDLFSDHRRSLWPPCCSVPASESTTFISVLSFDHHLSSEHGQSLSPSSCPASTSQIDRVDFGAASGKLTVSSASPDLSCTTTMAKYTATDVFALMVLITWSCVNTRAYIDPRFYILLDSQARVSALFRSAGFSFCAGLFGVLTAASPPPLQWLKSRDTFIPKVA